MRVIYLLLSFMLCFYPVTQAQNTTNQFMTQAQSRLRTGIDRLFVITFLG